MMKLYGLFQQEKQQNPNRNNMKGVYMRDEYDFSNAIKNPYVAKNKQQITIRLDQQVIDYFKNMSEETGMPYQNIINYYLLQCVKEELYVVNHIFELEYGINPQRRERLPNPVFWPVEFHGLYTP